MLRGYGQAMLTRIVAVAVLVGGWSAASAEVVVLKDKVMVIGKILVEKRDQVVVDLGYTVLPIPRSQILRVAKEGERETRELKGKPTPIAPVSPGPQTPDSADLYNTAKSSTTEKAVR